MSATYREDSKVTPASLAADPYDRLFSRGARVRLSAEQLRDQGLCISGELCPEMYGPSVFPYQPKGIWSSPWNGTQWVISQNGEQDRRALYTYWKRTAAYPEMVSFDATSREVCTARRIRTNTPLQALVTLNDSVYLEMARQFAHKMDSLRPGDPAGQIAEGYRCMLYEPISPQKLQVLMGLYGEALRRYRVSPRKAEELLGGNAWPARSGVGSDCARQAALVVVANALLNLDEVVTKN